MERVHHVDHQPRRSLSASHRDTKPRTPRWILDQTQECTPPAAQQPPTPVFSQAQTSRYLSHLRLLLCVDVQSVRRPETVILVEVLTILKNTTWLSSTDCLFWSGQKRPPREREWSALGSSPFMPSSSRRTVPNHNKTLPVASKTWKQHHHARDYTQHWLEQDPELLPSDYQGPWVSDCLGFMLHQILWDTLLLAWCVHHCPWRRYWWPPLKLCWLSAPCLLKPSILHHLLQTVTFYISSVLSSALNPCRIVYFYWCDYCGISLQTS